jgi:flagellar basal-body rod protein FlgB
MLISASDPVASVLHSALDGLSQRQRVVADNIANVDTPGFTASRLDFESSLKSAIEDGVVESGESQPTATPSAAVAGANGNNVDLASETMIQMQATFSYQLLSRAVGDRFSLISTAIGGM